MRGEKDREVELRFFARAFVTLKRSMPGLLHGCDEDGALPLPPTPMLRSSLNDGQLWIAA